MTRRNILGRIAIISFGLAFAGSHAMAQQHSLKVQLVGTWTMILCEAVQSDGTTGPLVTGSDPAGQYIFTENGRFSFQAIARLPNFASGSRTKTTPEEDKAPTLQPDAPVKLFATRVVGGGVDVLQGRQYDVAPDGRFLINTEVASAAAPITLIQNWNPETNKQ